MFYPREKGGVQRTPPAIVLQDHSAFRIVACTGKDQDGEYSKYINCLLISFESWSSNEAYPLCGRL
jgi:hypothetical protein